MFCEKCGAKIADGQSCCPSCGTSTTGNNASGATLVGLRKMKKAYLIAGIAGIGCFLLMILIGIVALSSDKLEAVTPEEALKNGEELREWIRLKDSMTEMAREDGFAKLKGKTVMIEGNVREVGKSLLSNKTYVSLELPLKGNIQFNVKRSEVDKVRGWSVFHRHVLLGRVADTGLDEDDVVCDLAEVADDLYDSKKIKECPACGDRSEFNSYRRCDDCGSVYCTKCSYKYPNEEVKRRARENSNGLISPCRFCGSKNVKMISKIFE